MHDRFPYTDPLTIGGRHFTAEAILAELEPYVTEPRREKMAGVIAGRTYSVVPVVEGLFDRGNVSAVVRSAESMGYQALHVIELSKKFKQAERVTQGAEKWMDIHKWKATEDCYAHLRERGYRILAAHVDDARPIGDYSFDEPTAIVFGNEREGVTRETLDAADGRVVVPMSGFSQSFNISVAAALTLYHVREQRARLLGTHGDLSEEQRRVLTAVYYMRSVEQAEAILLRGAEAASP
jgi:tRNA (guanosine-2'-O-)-methyltransferase